MRRRDTAKIFRSYLATVSFCFFMIAAGEASAVVYSPGIIKGTTGNHGDRQTVAAANGTVRDGGRFTIAASTTHPTRTISPTGTRSVVSPDAREATPAVNPRLTRPALPTRNIPYAVQLDLDADLGNVCSDCALPSTDVIDVDKNGRIFIKDSAQIAVFNQQGNKLFEFGGRCDPGQEASSTNCVDPDGSGPLSPGDGQFKGAIGGIAVSPDGKVYVSDSGNDRVVVFTFDGTYLFAFGSKGSGEGQLENPEHIDVAGNGRVYVQDKYNRRIQVFNPDGSFYKTIQLSGSWSNGLAPAPRIRNNKLYTMAMDFSDCTMRVLTLEGALIEEYEVCKEVLRGGANGPSDYEDFEIDSNGNYYFLDINAHENYQSGTIHVTDSHFNKIATYSNINNPRGIVLEEYLRFPKLYIASRFYGATGQDMTNHLFARLAVFDARQLLPVRLPPVQLAGNAGAANQRLNDPNDISVSGENVHVLDRNNNRIANYGLAGQFVRAFPFPFQNRTTSVWGNNQIVVRGDTLVVAEAQTGRVTVKDDINSAQAASFVYNPDGQYTKISALEVGPNGDIYLAGKNDREIDVFSNTGQHQRTFSCGSDLYPGPITALRYNPINSTLFASSRDRIVEISPAGACTPIPARYVGPDGSFRNVGGDIQDIAIDGSGRIYVLQSSRVQAFDQNWNFLKKFGLKGTAPGELSGALAIDTGVGDHVFVLQSRWGFTDGITRQQYQVFKPYPNASVLGVDSDADGIRDVSDKCPAEAENFNNIMDADGCPDMIPAGRMADVESRDQGLPRQALPSRPASPETRQVLPLPGDRQAGVRQQAVTGGTAPSQEPGGGGRPGGGGSGPGSSPTVGERATVGERMAVEERMAVDERMAVAGRAAAEQDPKASLQDAMQDIRQQAQTEAAQDVAAAQYSPGVITGQITDTGNRSVAGAQVTAYDDDSTSKDELIGRATTDANGRYTIRIPKRTTESQWDGPKTSLHTQWRPDIYITAARSGYQSIRSKTYSDHRLDSNLRIDGKMTPVAPVSPSRSTLPLKEPVQLVPATREVR